MRVQSISCSYQCDVIISFVDETTMPTTYLQTEYSFSPTHANSRCYTSSPAKTKVSYSWMCSLIASIHLPIIEIQIRFILPNAAGQPFSYTAPCAQLCSSNFGSEGDATAGMTWYQRGIDGQMYASMELEVL